MKYTAEEVRAEAKNVRIYSSHHPGAEFEWSRNADMLTDSADSIERAQDGVTDEVVFQAMAVFYGYGCEYFNKDDDEFAEMRAALLAVWPNPPAQAAQGEASLGRCKTCGRATRSVCDGLDGNGLGCTNAPPIALAAAAPQPGDQL